MKSVHKHKCKTVYKKTNYLEYTTAPTKTRQSCMLKKAKVLTSYK